MKRINAASDLAALAAELRVRPDWHKPGEQEVNAYVVGDSRQLDNAMGADPDGMYEPNVVIVLRGDDIAAVNLANLLAWAARTPMIERTRDRLQDVVTRLLQATGQTTTDGVFAWVAEMAEVGELVAKALDRSAENLTVLDVRQAVTDLVAERDRFRENYMETGRLANGYLDQINALRRAAGIAREVTDR
jgi:hypothetical protein